MFTEVTNIIIHRKAPLNTIVEVVHNTIFNCFMQVLLKNQNFTKEFSSTSLLGSKTQSLDDLLHRSFANHDI